MKFKKDKIITSVKLRNMGKWFKLIFIQFMPILM